MKTAKRPLLRRSVLLALALALVGAGTAQADKAGSATAGSGTVTATLTWKAGDPAVGGVSEPQLTIVRAGATAFDMPIATEDCSACSFATGTSTRSDPVTVRDIDGDGEPEVLIDTYSGGAHCCYSSLVYQFNGSTYTHVQQLWGDPGAAYRDLDHDGKTEFVTQNDVFAYTFTSYAYSYLPVLIESYQDGRFSDVTARYPAQLRSDARRILKQLAIVRRQKGDLRGLVAAYVADEDTLAQEKTGLAFLTRERRNHDLGSPTRARAFEKLLGTFLAKYGFT